MYTRFKAPALALRAAAAAAAKNFMAEVPLDHSYSHDN
jgi:hypothetical protein